MLFYGGGELYVSVPRPSRVVWPKRFQSIQDPPRVLGKTIDKVAPLIANRDHNDARRGEFIDHPMFAAARGAVRT